MITGYATQITELHFTLNRQHFRLRSFASLCLDCPVFWGDRRSFQIRYASHFYPGLAMIFLRDRFCLSAASLSRQHDILDFSYCPFSRVLHVTLANWQRFGFEFHLRSSPFAYSGFVNISRPAEYFTALKRPNKVETAVHGYNLAFSLDVSLLR